MNDVPQRMICGEENWIERLRNYEPPFVKLDPFSFSKYHPLDPAHTPEAYQKNRRIEIKLTSQ